MSEKKPNNPAPQPQPKAPTPPPFPSDRIERSEQHPIPVTIKQGK